jgi:small-conductance mechanosensitive channel
MDQLPEMLLDWLARHNVGLLPVVLTVVLLIAAMIAIMLLKRLLRLWLQRLQPRLHLPYETALAITRVVTAALWIITLLLALEIWGVGVGGVWTALVSVAAVIGAGFLATWAMISNITASLFITIWRPFHLGDTVEIVPENLKGRVIDSNLMFVAMREASGAIIQVPNNLFFQKMFKVIDGGTQPLFETLEPKAVTRSAMAPQGPAELRHDPMARRHAWNLQSVSA